VLDDLHGRDGVLDEPAGVVPDADGRRPSTAVARAGCCVDRLGQRREPQRRSPRGAANGSPRDDDLAAVGDGSEDAAVASGHDVPAGASVAFLDRSCGVDQLVDDDDGTKRVSPRIVGPLVRQEVANGVDDVPITVGAQ
jgi:hypothetical protein